MVKKGVFLKALKHYMFILIALGIKGKVERTIKEYFRRICPPDEKVSRIVRWSNF